MKRDIKTLDDAKEVLNIHGIEKSRVIVRDAPSDVESYSWVLGEVRIRLGEARIRDKEVWLCDLEDALAIIDSASEMPSISGGVTND